MSISNFENLRCWQLADSLRKDVDAICAKAAVARDFEFCDDFRGAAGSICRNLAEGFGRFRSAEIVKFFRYALASLAEVQDHLKESRARKFIDETEYDRLWDVAEHCKATALNFMKPHVERARRRRNRRRPTSSGGGPV